METSLKAVTWKIDELRGTTMDVKEMGLEVERLRGECSALQLHSG
jgi:hypothetical protein